MNGTSGRGSKSILIIDDDEGIREAIRDTLELEGYRTHLAASGAEALDRLRDIPPPGLILLDLTMPYMNGYEFLSVVGSDPRHSACPVVVLSASGSNQKPEGAAAFVRKPVELEKLLAITSRYCDSN